MRALPGGIGITGQRVCLCDVDFVVHTQFQQSTLGSRGTTSSETCSSLAPVLSSFPRSRGVREQAAELQGNAVAYWGPSRDTPVLVFRWRTSATEEKSPSSTF